MPVNVSLSLLTTILLLKFTSLHGYNKTRALAAKPRFNDRALLARCSKHIQFVFNLIANILMDIIVINGQLTAVKKGIR